MWGRFLQRSSAEYISLDTECSMYTIAEHQRKGRPLHIMCKGIESRMWNQKYFPNPKLGAREMAVTQEWEES